MGVRVVSHCGLVCISLISGDVEHLSHAYWPFIFFGELSIQVLCPFLVVFFVVVSYLYILDINCLSNTRFASMFFQFMGFVDLVVKIFLS